VESEFLFHKEVPKNPHLFGHALFSVLLDDLPIKLNGLECALVAYLLAHWIL